MSRYSLGIIKEFTTRNFRVVLDAEEEFERYDACDEKEQKRVDRALENGDLVLFSARARVFFKGTEVGSDYLGMCCYKSLADFWDLKAVGKQNRKYEKKGETGRCGSYARDMIRQAINEARSRVCAMQEVNIRRAS